MTEESIKKKSVIYFLTATFFVLKVKILRNGKTRTKTHNLLSKSRKNMSIKIYARLRIHIIYI